MISKSSGNPVDGGFESGPEGKAQGFVRGVLQAAGRPHGFTGGVGQFEVSVHRLETKKQSLQPMSVQPCSQHLKRNSQQPQT